jgi:prephenate dehydratase
MTEEALIVAFQGEPGAYSEQAIREHYGPATATLPCRTFSEIISSIHSGHASHGMLPVENSLAGMVIPAYDLLLDHDLRVQAEVIVKIEHHLMASAGTPLAEIKRAMSHHQALAQCEQNLRRMEIEPVDHYDTAGAARDLAMNPRPNMAAIASKLAAETYNLEILASNIEDMSFNYTRFFVLGRLDPPRVAQCKTSIIFTTRHVPGALYAILGELATRGINLTKIESRPRRNRPWHYRFFVDFEGHEDDPAVQEAMLGILKHSSFLQVLGSYPMAKTPLD